MYYVYILQSQKNYSYYVGFSEDLRERVKQHQQGKVRSTKPLGPYKPVYYEAYLNKRTAIKRENQLKHQRLAKEEII